jgi:hypothetical protein
MTHKPVYCSQHQNSPRYIDITGVKWWAHGQATLIYLAHSASQPAESSIWEEAHSVHRQILCRAEIWNSFLTLIPFSSQVINKISMVRFTYLTESSKVPSFGCSLISGTHVVRLLHFCVSDRLPVLQFHTALTQWLKCQVRHNTKCWGKLESWSGY